MLRHVWLAVSLTGYSDLTPRFGSWSFLCIYYDLKSHLALDVHLSNTHWPLHERANRLHCLPLPCYRCETREMREERMREAGGRSRRKVYKRRTNTGTVRGDTAACTGLIGSRRGGSMPYMHCLRPGRLPG